MAAQKRVSAEEEETGTEDAATAVATAVVAVATGASRAWPATVAVTVLGPVATAGTTGVVERRAVPPAAPARPSCVRRDPTPWIPGEWRRALRRARRRTERRRAPRPSISSGAAGRPARFRPAAASLPGRLRGRGPSSAQRLPGQTCLAECAPASRPRESAAGKRARGREAKKLNSGKRRTSSSLCNAGREWRATTKTTPGRRS